MRRCSGGHPSASGKEKVVMAEDPSEFSDQSEGIRLCRRAVNADKRGHYEEAYRLYEEGVSLILGAIHGARGGQAKSTLMLHVQGYLKRMEQLKAAGFGRRAANKPRMCSRKRPTSPLPRSRSWWAKPQ